MPRQRRLHPDYEVNEDGSPHVAEPSDILDRSSVAEWLAEPVPPARRGGRGAPGHPAKAWFMEKGFFGLDAMGLDHKELTPIYQQVTGAGSKDLPSPRTVARWWAEWERRSGVVRQRGAPSNPARAWYMAVGFPKQAARGWTDRQLEVEYRASALVPPHPSARSLRRWRREWQSAQAERTTI